MIRSLQRRFILSAMLAITILLFVLLGAINVGNLFISERQNKQLINALLDEEAMLQRPPKNDRPRGFFGGPTDENARMSAVYFTVKVGRSCNIIDVNTSRIADVSDEAAKAIYQAAMESGAPDGKIRSFRYRAFQNTRDGSTVYLFLDTRMQMRGILRVLLFSLIAGVVCWLAMLLLVILISKRAIRPIAENIVRQKQFVTDAGHEIKTPLAIILANTEAMELYEGENKYSRNIREQTVRLNGLMQNLLALAKADEGQSANRTELLSLSAAAAGVLEMFAEPIERKGLVIEKQIDADVSMKADGEQIRRLISILVDNAVKYSPPQGCVRICLARRGKNIVFTTCNQCEPLPDCPPEKLFDRFYRADAARTQENGGYGIGLSAAKTIVELHGGTIRAAYSPPDQITFTVVFS